MSNTGLLLRPGETLGDTITHESAPVANPQSLLKPGESFGETIGQPEQQEAKNVKSQQPSTYQKLTNPENEIDPKTGQPKAGVISRTLQSAGAGLMALPGAIYHGAVDPATPEEKEIFAREGHSILPGELALERLTGAESIVNAGKAYANPETRPTLRGAMSVLPEALGGGIGTVAGGEAIGKGAGIAKEGSSAARESIGNKIHEPETGELTKGAEGSARGGGAAIGGGIGAGVGGGIGAAVGAGAGAGLGPSLLERMFPESKARVAARETYNSVKEITEAHEAALKEAQRMAETERLEHERNLKEEQKSRDELSKARDSYAQDRLNRQRAQDKLDAEAIKSRNQAERAKREAIEDRDKGFTQKGEDLMKRQKDQDALDAQATKAEKEADDARQQHESDLANQGKELQRLHDAHAKNVKSIEDARQQELAQAERLKEQHAASLNKRGGTPKENSGIPQGNATPFESNPQDLLTRTKKLVVPGEEPNPEDLKRAGDMTQVQLPKLKLLASFGDKLAQNELNRRLRNE